MSQVIIYQNPHGTNVCVCTPTGELPIQEVLTKDCPPGAIIVDSSTLPTGDDDLFFNAWVLNGSTISVNITKAISEQTIVLNGLAYAEAQHRAAKTGAGLSNVMSDADWITTLSTARAAIAASTTTAQLVAAIAPVQAAITSNKE